MSDSRPPRGAATARLPVRGAPPRDATTAEASLGDLAGGVALVVRCEGGSVAQLLHEGQAFTIGRGAECEVVIIDQSVSRRHARLSFAGGWRLEDLGSRNGTIVDGRRLGRGEQVALNLGSVASLGSATAVLLAAESSRFVPRSGYAGAGYAGAGYAGAAEDERGARQTSSEYVVRDAAMQRLDETIAVLAPSPLPVLIVGETGVGKELFACAIHARSPRAQRPLVQINSAAIPAGMIESELFGYERGAFTGAGQAKAGLLESADGGTVLFDEVGELPVTLQAKLLRVLETGQCQRLGALRPRAIDVRVVSSTNRDLRQAIADGEFRADLYHRLNGATVRIPPLRDRHADIVPLALFFVARMARKMGRAEPTLADDARAALEAYTWPGNVRELRNVMERAVVLARSGILTAANLELEGAARRTEPRPEMRETLPPPHLATGANPPLPPALEDQLSITADDGGGLRAELDAMERRRVVEALERCGNNQSRAAKMLGISRHALIARIERFHLQRPRKGSGE
jgi:two-component system response regulator AtoC